MLQHHRIITVSRVQCFSALGPVLCWARDKNCDVLSLRLVHHALQGTQWSQISQASLSTKRKKYKSYMESHRKNETRPSSLILDIMGSSCFYLFLSQDNSLSRFSPLDTVDSVPCSQGSPELSGWMPATSQQRQRQTPTRAPVKPCRDTDGTELLWGRSRVMETCKIRPHRRCWGVIVRMALVKGYRFTWGGGAIFRPKPPVFDRSWRSPSKNTVKNSTEDTCSWTCPSKIGKWKVKKPRVFQLFDLNFLVCNIFFCGSAGGRARRRIFEFLDPFSDWFSSFCDSRNTGFYSVFLFSACLTASFKTSKNLVNYAVLCYGVNENIVNTSVFWRWLKKHCKLQCFWPPDPQKPW